MSNFFHLMNEVGRGEEKAHQTWPIPRTFLKHTVDFIQGLILTSSGIIEVLHHTYCGIHLTYFYNFGLVLECAWIFMLLPFGHIPSCV